MRAGICSVPQTLTAEAASIVKAAIGLARRRGHAQVTPLHVASSMLASSAGLLRRACLQSHSHPLQCKALELCFNVALNRLPASTSSPLLGPPPHSSYPSLSNALVAAFKRAQAHQRRGSIENQQQPILALKIEVEQLVISILDDPSVSRVMREAGFSSTQVKAKVEQAVSLDISSSLHQTTTPVSGSQSHSKEITISTKPQLLPPSQSLPFHHFGLTVTKPSDQHVRNDDVVSVLNSLATKRRNVVVTGECLASSESVIRGVMERFERGHVPGELRSVRFISLPLSSLRNHSKEEVEQELVELRCIVKSYMNRGVVLYVGDLKWVSDFWSNYGKQRTNCYSTVERVIMELKRLVGGITESERLWLMGIATFQTYMKCKAGHPSLDTILELYPLTIPVGSLSLSLNLDSVSHSQSRSKFPTLGSSWQMLGSGADNNHLTSCIDYSVNLNRESQSIVSSVQKKEFTSGVTVSTSSSLPSWLLQYKEETERNKIDDKQECTNVIDLCKKLNSFCDSGCEQQRYPEKTIKFASSPPSPISVSSNDHVTNLSWPVIFQPKGYAKEHRILMSECSNEGFETNSRNDPKPDLLSNPNSSPNSASSSEALDDMEGLQSFKVFNADNLKILCNGLEKKVPWQKDIVPEITNAVLECRSGMSRGKSKMKYREDKEETWLFFLGTDSEGKEKIARELARLVFGSQTNFVSISLHNFSSTRADSIEESKNKRPRDELGCSYVERFGLALNENPHRVFFMEDVEQIDCFSQKGIKRAIENGRVTLTGSCENVPLKDAIIIFSCESFSSASRACSPHRKRQKTSHNEDKDDEVIAIVEKKPAISLDLNIAIEGENGDECSVTENGILEAVDRQIVFKIQE